MRVTRVLILTAALLTGAAGCASSHQVAVEPPASTLGTPFPQRAAQLAASWVGSPAQQTWEAGYVPLDDTTHLPAGSFHSGADKAAYLAGQFHFSVALPTGPARQTVHFDSGTQATRPGLSADQALRTEGTGHCTAAAGCPTWLTVTAARATTERVRTSQGMATVPAWAFRIQGYQGEFVFAAVAPEKIPKPAGLPHFIGYQGAALVSVSADGRTLTLGVPMGCGQQRPTGLVYETKDVVVIGATEKSASLPAGTVCAASMAMGRVQVRLGDVLDGRTVLDVETGLPQAPDA